MKWNEVQQHYFFSVLTGFLHWIENVRCITFWLKICHTYLIIVFATCWFSEPWWKCCLTFVAWPARVAKVVRFSIAHFSAALCKTCGIVGLPALGSTSVQLLTFIHPNMCSTNAIGSTAYPFIWLLGTQTF